MPRIVGIGIVVLLCAGGLAVYLSAGPPAARPPRAAHSARPPTRVLRVQAAGLVNPGPPARQVARIPRMLLVTGTGLVFVPVPRSQFQVGMPQWTTDEMAGGTDIFIYLRTGRCLAAVRQAGHWRLATRRCDLGSGQRWQPVNRGVGGQVPFAQYRNLASGQCLAAGRPAAASPAPGAPLAAVLGSCGAAASWRGQIEFWWAA